MFRNAVLTGLAATIAAAAIAAPAHAQEIISPAQPSTPAAPIVPPAQPSTPTGTPSDPTVPPAQPTGPTAGATLRFGDCHVARSSHGYTYANCSVIADNVPFGQTVSVGYSSSLKTFKPRTHVKWGGTTGRIELPNTGQPGQTVGEPATITGGVKLAFRDKTVAQVRHELIVGSTGSDTAAVLQPIATTIGR
jgi:hypothetical protein